ncbi:MAG: BASS family bile acid:Na+ symporter [Arenicella sp.]|jgi:BASS family bile acid:Na+ symporter
MLEPPRIDDFALELGQGSEIGLALSLATMMFSVALGLKPSSFAFLRAAPRAFLIGITGQLLALPILTITLCVLIQPMPSVALGMILIACCPGGNVSNMLVLLARGNTALSVSLTATSSLAAAFITPVAVIFWSGLYPPTAELLSQIEFDAISFLLQTSVVLALPLVIGIAVNVYLPRLAAAIRQPLVWLSSTTLLVLILVGGARYWSDFVLIGVSLVGLVALHNALAFLLGNMLARLGGVSIADRRALTYEVGIQNAGLGIVILLTQMGGLGGAAVVAGLWGTWHIIAGLILVMVFRVADKLSVSE